MKRQHAERGGRRAEALAALWLRLKGWTILARRARTPVGEVDLVARRGRTLAELAERYADAAPKGEIVVVVGPPGEAEPAGEADVNEALTEAMSRLSVSRAAAEVAEKLGLPRREVYERALALK